MINTEEWGLVHTYRVQNSTGVEVAHVNKEDDVFVKTSSSSHGILFSNIYGRTLFARWKMH